jgi:prepilin-type N-terminal cleavage/methylation domain-containing protein
MAVLDARGVTLIELLVSMVLLAIALSGLAASFPLAMYGVTQGGYQTTATLLALKCTDDAKSIGYSQIPAVLPTVCSSGPVPGYPSFSRTLTIQPGVPTATTTTVTVTVQFSAGGTPTQTTLATIIAQ